MYTLIFESFQLYFRLAEWPQGEFSLCNQRLYGYGFVILCLPFDFFYGMRSNLAAVTR